MENTLPEWLITVCSGIGVIVAAAIARLGWKRADGARSEEAGTGLTAQISHLDSSSSVLLASALEAATKAAKDLAALSHADRELSAAAQRELATAIEGLTRIAQKMHDQHVREGEEREERERMDLVLEVERLRREQGRRGAGGPVERS